MLQASSVTWTWPFSFLSSFFLFVFFVLFCSFNFIFSGLLQSRVICVTEQCEFDFYLWLINLSEKRIVIGRKRKEKRKKKKSKKERKEKEPSMDELAEIVFLDFRS